MKKLTYLLLGTFLFLACNQEQRYFGESSETKALKDGITAYETGDWDRWVSHFADTAKIYVNSTKPVSVTERVASLKEMSSAMSSYGFDHEEEHIEMVVDKNDETWVYYWAAHKGTITANNKTLTIPVHIAVRFADGKIVTEHIYYDSTQLNAEFAAIAAAAESSEEEHSDEDTD
jgi:ketosteroid isomerase-like protein